MKHLQVLEVLQQNLLLQDPKDLQVLHKTFNSLILHSLKLHMRCRLLTVTACFSPAVHANARQLTCSGSRLKVFARQTIKPWQQPSAQGSWPPLDSHWICPKSCQTLKSQTGMRQTLQPLLLHLLISKAERQVLVLALCGSLWLSCTEPVRLMLSSAGLVYPARG